jgi:hypothetical protein
MKSSSKRKEILLSELIGNSKLEIFVENQESNCKLLKKTEFIFEINSSTKKNTEFSIVQLNQIRKTVIQTLLEYIQKTIDNINFFQIEFEPVGKDEKETEMKDILYNIILTKISKELSCIHSKSNNMHYLTFTSNAASA